MRTRRTLFPLLAFAALAGCAAKTDDARTEAVSSDSVASPASDPAAVRRTIDSVNVALAAALQKEDTAAHSAIYASDGMIMMAGMPAAKGRDAIRQHAAEMFTGADLTDVRFTTQGVDVSGDLAVETGMFSMTITPKGAKAFEDKGKYITVWKRQADGSWKIYRDISNSDLAAR
jgi:uncharacterized protein (TIGR02246 family)